MIETEEEAARRRAREQYGFSEDEEADGEDADSEGEPLRPMLSWIDYGDQEVDRSKYHIGEGFLEVGGIVMLIGQSYVGKSTFLTQLSIYFAVGRSWLSFVVDRPLRILIVQAEDSENKLKKMGKMYRRMGLTDTEIELARVNTRVLTIRDLQDASSIVEIERHALVIRPDIICVNPLTSYLSKGINVRKQIANYANTPRLSPSARGRIQRAIPSTARCGLVKCSAWRPISPLG